MSREPQGNAALLLIESLMHILLEKSVIDREEALSAVATAVEVELERRQVHDSAQASEALELLEGIAATFRAA
jgi:hypothetical protein